MGLAQAAALQCTPMSMRAAETPNRRTPLAAEMLDLLTLLPAEMLGHLAPMAEEAPTRTIPVSERAASPRAKIRRASTAGRLRAGPTRFWSRTR